MPPAGAVPPADSEFNELGRAMSLYGAVCSQNAALDSERASVELEEKGERKGEVSSQDSDEEGDAVVQGTRILDQVLGKKLDTVRGFLRRILREPYDQEFRHLLEDPKKKETLLRAELLVQHLCRLHRELNSRYLSARKFSDFEVDPLDSESSEFIKTLAKHRAKNYESAINNLSRIVKKSAKGGSSKVYSEALFPALDCLYDLCLDPSNSSSGSSVEGPRPAGHGFAEVS